jgi:hypothetical protein
MGLRVKSLFASDARSMEIERLARQIERLERERSALAAKRRRRRRLSCSP